ncbi:MAG: tetratricopeptide repeat protein [Myxococcales bacterium]|nr:tetratricopeptide repeat protein [Myxococcales bacterium]MBK7193921.1 tetratricopeptide repeat protein [Myxococcales bacterium]
MTDLGSAAASAFDRYEQHLIAGGELLRQSRLDDAQKELLAALEFDADGQKALALLGLAYFRAGKFAEALPVYRRLVGLSALDASHQLNLGLVLLKLGDAGAAAAALERSRDIDPSQGRAVSYLGLAYARGGRFAEAYQAFLQAGQRDLAREIADNLTEQERLAIERAQERRSAAPAPVDAASASTRFVSTPPVEEPAAKPAAAPAVAPEAEAEAEAAPAAAEASPAAVEPDAAPARATTADDDAFDALERIDAPAPAESTSVDDGAVLEVASAVESAPVPIVAPPPPPREPRPRLGSRRSAPPPPPRSSPALDVPAAADDLDAIVDEVDHGAISRAVAQAAPSAQRGAARVAAGHRPPQPLSEFATTRLVRLEDGDEPFEISAGGVLIVRVREKMFSRTEGVDVTGGELDYEPAQRRSRGQSRTEPFATAGRALFQVTGQGHLLAAPLGGQFTAVTLDDDIFYLREDLVFAFEPVLRWENGHVPGSRERIPMVQFRGTGAVAFRTERPLLSVKLAQDRVLYVDATALAGWIGRVVPRAVTPADGGPGSELFVECTGEGVVLVEEEQAPARKHD